MRKRQRQRFGGWDDYGPTKSATFLIGRLPGLDGPWAPGQEIPVEQVIGSVLKHRVAQVGKEAGLTSWKVGGYYAGSSEPSTKVEIYNTGQPGGEFDRQMRELGQLLARDLAQREIIVVRHNGRRTVTSSASPTGAPAANAAGFCAWVRAHSREARRNPKDRCHNG